MQGTSKAGVGSIPQQAKVEETDNLAAGSYKSAFKPAASATISPGISAIQEAGPDESEDESDKEIKFNKQPGQEEMRRGIKQMKEEGESVKKVVRPRKARVIANALDTEYEVVKEVMQDTLHYKLILDEEDEASTTVGEWDLYWADLQITAEMLTKMRPYQKVNHFPGMFCLSRKNMLGKNLMRMKKLLPEEYNFFPPTWLLPYEWSDFKRQFDGKPKTYIVKPEALSQGQGIYLTRRWETIDPREHYVVQRYIHKPYLIDGLKFDLRIYVLVYGCDPLRIFVYKEGLARLATEPYVSPALPNIDNLYVHLTNYAINKNNENYEFNQDEETADVGHKRSLDFVWRYIRNRGGDVDALQKEIHGCIIKTLCAVQPLLAHTYRSCQPNDVGNNMCFEILGFDILLDHKLKPWLLEVNHAPSFSIDTPFDHRVKAELLADSFILVHIDAARRTRYYRKKQAYQYARLTASGKIQSRLTKEQRLAKKQHKMNKRDQYEASHLGGYLRVFPDPQNSAKHETYLTAAIEAEGEFSGSRKKVPRKPSDDAKSEAPPKPFVTSRGVANRTNPRTVNNVHVRRAPANPPKSWAKQTAFVKDTSCTSIKPTVTPTPNPHPDIRPSPAQDIVAMTKKQATSPELERTKKQTEGKESIALNTEMESAIHSVVCAGMKVGMVSVMTVDYNYSRVSKLQEVDKTRLRILKFTQAFNPAPVSVLQQSWQFRPSDTFDARAYLSTNLPPQPTYLPPPMLRTSHKPKGCYFANIGYNAIPTEAGQFGCKPSPPLKYSSLALVSSVGTYVPPKVLEFSPIIGLAPVHINKEDAKSRTKYVKTYAKR